MPPSLTIINEKGVKGLLLLGLTKREREDVIDMIELSSPQSQHETRERLREERISLMEMEKLSKKAG